MTADALTICSVSYESGRLLARNVRLARELNPDDGLAWRVAENSPDDSALRVPPTPGVELRPGVPVPDVRYQAASYHHGAALNTLLDGIPTRHVLVIDPDFFVILPGWVEACRRHVEDRGLAFLGAPWHPRWFTKPRGFPSPHFLWIDGSRVDVSSLDFLPAGDQAPWEQVHRVSRMRRRGDRVAGAVVPEWMERRAVGRSRDTGWRVHERYAASATSECLVPYYAPERHRPGGRGTPTARVADAVLPSGLRLVPQRGSATGRGSAARGLPDLDAQGWEEFTWRDEPFAFHVRGFPVRARTGAAPDAADAVERALEAILQAGRTLP